MTLPDSQTRLRALLTLTALTLGVAPGAQASVQTPRGPTAPASHGTPRIVEPGPEFEGVDLREAFDPDEDPFEVSARGLEARLFQGGDINVNAELNMGGRLRLQASWRDITLAAESSFTTWRVSVGYPQRLPLTNVVLLSERMESGMDGVHAAVATTERLGNEPFQTTGLRLRPYARSLRLAGEALNSLSRARPGWIVGVDLRGKVYQPLGLAFEPKLELQATATLIF